MAGPTRPDQQHHLPGEVDAYVMWAFLDAIVELIPDFWINMRREVQRALGPGAPTIGDPDAAIREWAARYDLDVEWVRVCAGDQFLRPGRPPTSILPRRVWVQPEDRTVPAIGWDFMVESERSFDERVKEYKAVRRREAAEAGSIQMTADPVVIARNLRWLVRWHVFGESFSDIARAEKAHGDKREVPKLVTIISEAAHRLHKRLGLPPRTPGKRLTVPRSGTPT